MNNTRPYVLLARLDSDAHARWWIREPDGWYTEWQPMSSSLPRRRVKAHRLAPARSDSHTYVGDPQAVAELHRVRDEVERVKS